MMLVHVSYNRAYGVPRVILSDHSETAAASQEIKTEKRKFNVDLFLPPIRGICTTMHNSRDVAATKKRGEEKKSGKDALISCGYLGMRLA